MLSAPKMHLYLRMTAFGPPPKEPKGLAEPLRPGGRPFEDPTSASNPGPEKQRIQFVVAIEGPNKEYFSEVHEDVIMRHKAFNHIAQEEPLPITKDAACGNPGAIQQWSVQYSLGPAGGIRARVQFLLVGPLEEP